MRQAGLGPGNLGSVRRAKAGMPPGLVVSVPSAVIVRGQLADDGLCVLVHTAEQRRADPVLVPQSNEAKARRGGDDASAVIRITVGSEHRQLNPAEIRAEPGAPDNRPHVFEHTPVVELRVPVRHAYRAADGRQHGDHEGPRSAASKS